MFGAAKPHCAYLFANRRAIREEKVMGKVAMKEGVKQRVYTALDAKDELCGKMIDAGVDPKQALLASTVVTKDRMDAMIDRHYANASASDFTSGISNGVPPTLN